jgi:long-chain acyl-CoA synthetase
LRTLEKLFKDAVQTHSSHTAYQIKKEGAYQTYSFSQVGKMVQSLQSELKSLGVAHGTRVGIISENRPEWGMSYFSIVNMGAVVVPLDPQLSANEIVVLGNDSEVKGIYCSSNYLPLVLENASRVPSLEFVICFDCNKDQFEGTANRAVKVLDFKALSSKAASALLTPVKGDDLAALVYTSGTTGVPKGVMLTHHNLASNVASGLKVIDLNPRDNMLSVLPLHHTFECTCGFLAAFSAGTKVTYIESLKSYVLVTAMKETKTTIMLAVPLLYRLFYDSIMREVSDKGKAFQTIFSVLYNISKLFLVVVGVNIGKKLFGSLHKKLGGKIRFWVSGGAAIDPALLRSFEILGITIIQGYGLTESSPILSACSQSDNRIGSVGKALPEIEIRISDPDGKGSGEIIARGPNIMQGYYKRKDFTNEVLKGGWLYTGDVGHIDEDGFLFITGRSKDVIVTGAGVNVYPEEIEVVLNKIPGIKESCVFGKKIKEGHRSGMEQVQAVVLPNQEYFEKYACEHKLPLSDDFIKETIQKEINTYNSNTADYKRIEKLMITNVEFPKTTTRKIKRFVVKKEWGAL